MIFPKLSESERWQKVAEYFAADHEARIRILEEKVQRLTQLQCSAQSVTEKCGTTAQARSSRRRIPKLPTGSARTRNVNGL